MKALGNMGSWSCTLDVAPVRDLHSCVHTLSVVAPTFHWSASVGKLEVSAEVGGSGVCFTFEGVSDDVGSTSGDNTVISTELDGRQLVRLVDMLPVQPTMFVTEYSKSSNRVLVRLVNPGRKQTMWLQDGPYLGSSPAFFPSLPCCPKVVVSTADLAYVLLLSTMT